MPRKPTNSSLGELPRLPRSKGALKKALIECGIGFRTPNSWSDSESAFFNAPLDRGSQGTSPRLLFVSSRGIESFPVAH